MENKYKECVEQTIEMLRAYNREPCEDEIVSTCIVEMTNTIFSEMLLYLPTEKRDMYKKAFERDR